MHAPDYAQNRQYLPGPMHQYHPSSNGAMLDQVWQTVDLLHRHLNWPDD